MNVFTGTTARITEKRRFPRRRVLKQGRIILNSRFSVIDCMVRDVSVGGCRLRLHAMLTLPESFLLGFPSLGVERQVRLVWQHERDIGVAFLDPAPPAFARLALPPGMPDWPTEAS